MQMSMPENSSAEIRLSQEDPDFFDKLDNLIMGAMNTRKYMSVEEIALGVVAKAPMSREIVKNRVITLSRGPNFVRQGTGRSASYKLTKLAAAKLESDSTQEEPASVAVEQNTPDPVVLENRQVEEVEGNATPDAALAKSLMTIDASEGTEVCIWKVMCDYKPYTVEDVALLLSDSGIKIRTIQTAMSKLYHNKKWFTRYCRVEGGPYVHVLKPEISMPKPIPYVQKEIHQTPRDKPNNQPPRENVPIMDDGELQPVENASVSAPETTPVQEPETTLAPDVKVDGIQVQIWRVTTDGNWFDIPDVINRLSHTGIRSVSIGPYISIMYGRGWYIREKNGKGRGFRYKMKPGVKVPYPFDQVKTNDNNQQQDDNMTYANVEAVKPTLAPTDQPLVEINVVIAGVKMTLQKARELRDEIVDFGYDVDDPKVLEGSGSILKRQTFVYIEGVALTPTQLHEIYQTLQSAQIG